MSKLVFPASKDGLQVDALIGLDGARTAALFAAGQPIPAPIHARAAIDTGSSITAISAAIRQRLGVGIEFTTTTQTASSQTSVDIYQVSVGIRDLRNPAIPELVESSLYVMELPTVLPGIDVLIGLDFLLGCKFALDGPAREFSLEG